MLRYTYIIKNMAQVALSTVLVSILFIEGTKPTQDHERINFYHLPGVFEGTYGQPGDIVIGSLSITLDESSEPAKACSHATKGLTYTAETSEAIAFAVNLINKDPTILPNVSLGFAMRGVCDNSPGVALATSLSFLPRSQLECDNDTSSCNVNTRLGADLNWNNDGVIALVSPDLDSLTTMISSLYAVAQLPIVGATEVGDDLSNKVVHPYFFRLVPPSMYQVKAMLKFMAANGWSYISIVYQDGPYGQKAYETMVEYLDDYGICMAASFKLDAFTNYNELVTGLLHYPRARAVVLFMSGSRLRKILKQVINNNATGHFIFLGDKNIVDYSGLIYIGTPNDPAIGIFTFDLYHTYVMPFYEYLSQQEVETSKNPWLRGAYEYIRECSYDLTQNETKPCSPAKPLFGRYRYRTSKAVSWRIDAVLTIARAAHNLLSERCPDALGKETRACITGEMLREYLKNVSFKGFNGKIKFDENQDVKGKYVIGQFVYDYYDYPFAESTRWKHMTRKNVAVYDSSYEVIEYLDTPISWSHVNKLERVVPWTNDSLPIEIPESVCSRPCVTGEYKIEKEVPCCWDCLRCRDNERLVNNNTGCEACPSLTWPDPLTDFTTCLDIPPTYPKIGDTLPIALNSCAFLLILVTIAVFTCYVIYRNERVIKASSKELSVIQLTAIFLGYLTVVLFQTKPDHYTCSAIFVLFCMSFAMLYCPLLVKTIRIFRIFTSGAKNEKPRFISPTSQLAVTAFLIVIQVALCGLSLALFEPTSRRSQPIWSEKLVELSCDLTFPGLASFLGYNMVLIFLCSVFAFMVRKLPDNFNESKFISMCVSTTLLIWLAFVPTYFTAGREYIRTFLLCMALLLNHSVALVLLFMPKIYAAIFVPSDTGNFSNKRS